MTKPWTQQLYEELTEEIPERWVAVNGAGEEAVVLVAPTAAFPLEQKLNDGERDHKRLESEYTSIAFLVEALEDDPIKGDEV